MKRIHSTLFLILLFITSNGQSQADISNRSSIDLVLWPFCHGVASGDPTPESVIIWTRLTPDQLPQPYSGSWAVATDTGMTNVVRSGSFVTSPAADFTVNIDVDSLTPDSWYYYRFEMNGRKSLTGRTRTAPVGDVDSLRFGVVSCSDYAEGYFHGYRKLAERNDLDAIIHLGDYIYENGAKGDLGRPHEPLKRTTELNDYRQRYSQYRLDPDLRCIHQMYPFINVWDDHELANNAWADGAAGHDPAKDGIWAHRKRMAAQAFFEWIPMRKPDMNDTLRIYRSSEWGDLATFYMIDSRLIGRDSQTVFANFGDTTRYMLGKDQLRWLATELDSSQAQWNIIGQQVFMAPLEIPLVGPVNPDGWDGYEAERNRLYDTLISRNLENVVVLTGDIHTAWANNLEKDTTKVGVEFVCSSITKQNFPFSVPASVITLANPHIKFAEIDGHGFTILDINKARTQADFFFVGDITVPGNNSLSSGPYWRTNNGDRFVQEDTAASIPRSTFPVLQPPKTVNNPVAIEDPQGPPKTSLLGVYPNPFWDSFLMKLQTYSSGSIEIKLQSLAGKLIEQKEMQMSPGVHYIRLQTEQLESGTYLLSIDSEGKITTRKVVKL